MGRPRKTTWQLPLAVILTIAAVGDHQPARAGDTELLEQQAAESGQTLEDFLRSLHDSGDQAPDPAPRRRALGALHQVQRAAEVMIEPRVAGDWGWAGRLTPEDLTNDFATFGADGGLRAFNVLDAEGFFERFKCNLFVFELAYRAGLLVPVMGRSRGWGYIGPPEVLRQIERGSFDRGWAVLADERDVDELRAATREGIPFVLIAEGRDGRAGHMGMVDQFHVVERDEEGRIHRIVYTGWEANGEGAHYRRRTWGLWRFERIHVLELQEPRPGQAQVFPIDAGPPLPSELDARRAIAAVSPGARPPSPSIDPAPGPSTRRLAAASRRVLGGARSPSSWTSRRLPRPWAALARGRLDLVRFLGLDELFGRIVGPHRSALSRRRPLLETAAIGGGAARPATTTSPMIIAARNGSGR